MVTCCGFWISTFLRSFTQYPVGICGISFQEPHVCACAAEPPCSLVLLAPWRPRDRRAKIGCLSRAASADPHEAGSGNRPRPGHLAVLGLELETLLHPRLKPALQVVGVPPRLPESRGGKPRAASGAAIEDHRAVLGDCLRLARQLVDLDVARTHDPPRLPLVRAADVDQRGAGADQLEGSRRRDPGLVLRHESQLMASADGYLFLWSRARRMGDSPPRGVRPPRGAFSHPQRAV